MDLRPINPSKVYLISYFAGEDERVFEQPKKETSFYVVTGGPVPIRNLKVEMGTKIFKVPDGIDPFSLGKEMGGYVAKGYPADEDVIRTRV